MTRRRAAVGDRPRTSLLLIGIAYLAFVAIGLPAGLLGVGWPSIRDTFDQPDGALGLVLGAVTLGYLISSFAAGRVLSRLGVGPLLTMSCLLLAGSLLGNSLTPVWWLFLALGVALGLGSGFIDTGLNIYVATHHGARTMNWLHACFGLGATLGPAVMTTVLGFDLSWRWGYGLIGGVLVGLAACFVLTRNWWTSPARTAVRPADRGAPATPYLATLRLLAAWLGILFFFVHVGVEVIAGQWSYTLFTEERGVSESTAGTWISLYWGSLTVGRILFGALVAVARMDVLLRGCMAAVIAGGAMIWADLSDPVNAAGLALIGLALAPVFPSMIATTPERMGPAHTGNGVGFQVGAAVLGGALIPGAVGVLADRIGLEVVGPALVITATLQLVMYLLIAATARNAAARVPLPPARDAG